MAGDHIHGINVRGSDRVPPRSPSFEGRFGRMFRKLPPAQTGKAFLVELADRMRERAATTWGDPDFDAAMPAGYTYLGQFIDHDVTFDPTSSLDRANDPDALVNFRTPRFDLDSVYGSGPADDPFLYDRESAHGLKLLVGSVEGTGEGDLPRNVQGRALLGDPRNDENVIVSQLHLAFIRAHNRAVDEVSGRFDDDEERLKAAQRMVRWQYQWLVVHDYLRRILDGDTYDRLVVVHEDGREEFVRRFYKPRKNAYLPVEFSVAAFRFGHSMIRPTYVINDVVPELPIFAPGDVGPLEDFRGFRPLPAQWTVAWGRFFDRFDDAPLQVARKIDANLAEPLFTLPGFTDQASLAHRNLLRGRRFGLPSGQSVARAVGAEPLTAADLDFDTERDAPLWYYVLKEAEVVNGGERLGPVGSVVVGETLLGLLEADPLSYVNAPGWPAEVPQPQTTGSFLRWALGLA